ncbi:MAG: hypothetical protein ABIR18_04150 [Chitinophagaceae bacterium]
MKHLLTLIIATSFFLACNNKKVAPATETSTNAEVSTKDISEAQKKTEELQQLTPYTQDQMKALLPAALDDDTATILSASTNMGTGFVQAIYPLSDSTSVEINLFDCGGNAGAGIYNAQLVNQLDNQSANETEYTKAIDYNGGKAIEHFDKKSNNATLTYFTADRLLVIIEGTNTGIDEVKKIAGKLKFK